MADDQKRRELIFQMAMDMNRKNAREPHVTGQASMSQGDPPESKGLEDTMQLDEILALPAAVVTPMLVKKIAQYEAKRLGPAAAKLQKTTGQAGARMGMLQRAEEMEKRNAEHSGSSLWMNPQYASELGVPHNPMWDLGPSALKPELEKRLDSGWLEAASKRKQGYLDDVKSGKKGNTEISKPWDYKTSSAMAPAEEVSASEIEDMLEQMAKSSPPAPLPLTGGRGIKNPVRSVPEPRPNAATHGFHPDDIEDLNKRMPGLWEEFDSKMALAIDGKLSQKEAGLFARDLHSMSREASTDRGTADTLSMMADKIGKHGMKAGKASPPAAAVREMEPTNSMKRVPPKPKKPDTVVPSGSRALRDKELQSRVDSMVDEMHRSGTKLRVADVEKFADELEDKALGLMESKNERLADEAEKMIATSELLRKTAWDLLE